MKYCRLLCVLAMLSTVHVASAQQKPVQRDGVVRVERVQFSGMRRTRVDTLLELLPRQPPAYYRESELKEFDRRISNLAVFDSVLTERKGDVYEVALREKWTLIPVFDFATGKTAKDTYAALGAVEYNAFGTGTTISANVSYVQRGLNFSLDLFQHPYRPSRWSFGFESGYETQSFRFDTDESWTRKLWGIFPYWAAPLSYGFPVRYEVGLHYYREDMSDVEGGYRPPNGNEFGMFMGFTWDRYRWHDLAPNGYMISLYLQPGWLVGPGLAQSRSKMSIEMTGALRFTDTTVLMAQSKAGVATRGNPNFSYLIGSFQGVRGIEDAFYRTWINAFVNVEFRQAVRLATRWALQGVLFSDAAAFETLTVHGHRGAFDSAVSSGVGARVVPLWLSDVVLRFDYARLLYPTRLNFWQIGITQYF